MPANSLRALITCEVTPKFLASLEERNIDFELCGWGNSRRFDKRFGDGV
jgi:hypothetical protein